MAVLVLDCSVAISWVMADERSQESDRLLECVAENGAIAPALWPLEVGNTLLMAGRRKRLSPEQRNQALQALRQLPITLDGDTHHHAWEHTLQLADDNGLTLYDATYLELSLRLDLPLATYDEELSKVAKKMNVTVLR